VGLADGPVDGAAVVGAAVVGGTVDANDGGMESVGFSVGATVGALVVGMSTSAS